MSQLPHQTLCNLMNLTAKQLPHQPLSYSEICQIILTTYPVECQKFLHTSPLTSKFQLSYQGVLFIHSLKLHVINISYSPCSASPTTGSRMKISKGIYELIMARSFSSLFIYRTFSLLSMSCLFSVSRFTSMCIIT